MPVALQARTGIDCHTQNLLAVQRNRIAIFVGFGGAAIFKRQLALEAIQAARGRPFDPLSIQFIF